jgi:hypothetical protein
MLFSFLPPMIGDAKQLIVLFHHQRCAMLAGWHRAGIVNLEPFLVP